MAACVVPAWIWLLPADLEAFAHSLAFVSLFLSNFYFLENTDYFDAPTEELPLIHTWSLAVEEQYYVVFPVLVLFLWHRPEPVRIAVLVALFLGSLGWAQYASGILPQTAFYLLPSRFWELLGGAAVAIWLRKRAPTPSEPLSIAGLILILSSFFLFAEDTRHPSLLTLAPVVGTCLVILYAQGDTLVRRALSLPPVVGIGLISYSSYLWHQPLMAFARVRFFGEPSLAFMLTLGVLSLLLAWFTWRFVEQPFRRKQFPLFPKRRQLFMASCAGTAIFLTLGAIGELNRGFLQRYEGLELANYQYDNRKYQQESWEPLRQLSGIRDYRKRSLEYESQSWFSEDDMRRGVLITGDSHSKDLFNTLSASQSAMKAFKLARYAVQPEGLVNPRSAIFETPNFRDAEIVMIAPRYDWDELQFVGPAIKNLKSHGKTVVLVLNTPEFSGGLKTSISDSLILPILQHGHVAEPRHLADMVNAAFTEDLRKYRRKYDLNLELSRIGTSAGVIVMDRRKYICPDRCVGISDDLTKYIYDYGHISLAGAAYYGKVIDRIGWLDPILHGH